jgi:lysophospholipase-2
VVAYEHGENSARTLSAAGFQNLIFRSYNGYSSYFFFFFFFFFLMQSAKIIIIFVYDMKLFVCRLGHYTVPEETDEVCRWLTANLALEGLRLN